MGHLSRITGLALFLIVVGEAAAWDDAMKVKYSDDTADGKQSIGGSGPMIEFELPSKTAKIAGLRIHGARYGSPQPPKESFLVYFLNQDRSRIINAEMAPLATFERGEEKWTTVNFDKPIAVPDRCWIALDFRAGPTKGVYVSYDTSTSGKHSLIGLPGTPTSEPKHGGDWMIEVILAE